MNPVKDVVEGKILSEMKKYRQKKIVSQPLQPAVILEIQKTQDIRSMRFSVSF